MDDVDGEPVNAYLRGSLNIYIVFCVSVDFAGDHCEIAGEELGFYVN
jgi:hypothetical protein